MKNIYFYKKKKKKKKNTCFINYLINTYFFLNKIIINFFNLLVNF